MNRLLSLLAVSIVASALDASVVRAQSFKVTRFEIGGEGGTDYVTAEPGTGRRPSAGRLLRGPRRFMAAAPRRPCTHRR